MSNRYLFRGNTARGKRIVYGNYWYNEFDQCHYIKCLVEGGTQYEDVKVIPETVGQWTGLLDKNKCNIFDKDKVHCNGVDYLVVWEIGKAPELRSIDNDTFCGFLFNYNKTIEVIHD